MQRLLLTVAAFGLAVGPALAAGPTSTVTAAAGTSTTATANSTTGGTAIATSFGLAGTTTSVGSSTATTTSYDATQVRGFAVGNASFAGSSQAHAMSSGWSSWSH
jgi:hypothetical protein